MPKSASDAEGAVLVPPMRRRSDYIVDWQVEDEPGAVGEMHRRSGEAVDNVGDAEQTSEEAGAPPFADAQRV